MPWLKNLEQRNSWIVAAQRAQRMFFSCLFARGPEREYLGTVQGLADAYCELQILKTLLENDATRFCCHSADLSSQPER